MFASPQHRRQFVLGPRPSGPAHWRRRTIGALHLSHCPELPVDAVVDRDGCTWVLVGRPLPGARPTAPAADVAAARTADVVAVSQGWSGRWLIVADHVVSLDASGLLGCLWGIDAAGSAWSSSSPALLASLVGAEVVDDRRLVHGVGVSWICPPRTRFDRVHRLRVGEVLDPATGATAASSYLPAIVPTDDVDGVLTSFASHLATTMRALSDQTDVSLGLTAGYDSRLVLAVAVSHGIPLTTFTRVAERSSAADRLIPPQLAAAVGVPHRFIRPSRPSSGSRDVADRHTAGHVARGDLLPLLQDTRRDVRGVSIGGHGLAIASGFGRLRRLPADPDELEDAGAALAGLFGESPDSSVTADLRQWVDWVRAHPVDHLDWRDRFFLEQRQAGWLSAKEQAYDLTTPERVPIANSASLDARLLSVPESHRLGSVLQERLIRRLVPELAAWPFNPTDREIGWRRAARVKLGDDPLHLLKAGGRRVRRRARTAAAGIGRPGTPDRGGTNG